MSLATAFVRSIKKSENCAVRSYGGSEQIPGVSSGGADSSDGQVEVRLISLDADASPRESNGSYCRCAASEERIENQVAFI